MVGVWELSVRDSDISDGRGALVTHSSLRVVVVLVEGCALL